MMPHFDALYGSREGCANGYDLRIGDRVSAQPDYPFREIQEGVIDDVQERGEWVGVYLVDAKGIRRVYEGRQVISRFDVDGYARSPRTPRPAAHPCNSCDGIDLPIVNDAGYCSACASDEG